MFNPAKNASGVAVSWQSVSNRFYVLERAGNLGTFSPVRSLKGQEGTTSYVDTAVTGPGPFFYRIRVLK